MKILVTGGSGLLGSRLIPALAEHHQVFALTRSVSSREKVRKLGASPVDGDLDGADALELPVVDAVVHAAAVFRFSGPRAPFFRANVDGTAKLLAASEKVGASHFVHVSAAGVVMDELGTPVCHADESATVYTKHFSAYLASKAQAELLVLAANTPTFRTIALRPPAVWGPHDSFSREIPRAIRSGQFAFIDRGDYMFSTCHVDNVVEAIQCALERGEGGRAFFIADREIQSFREFVKSVASVEGLSVERLHSMSYGVASTIGRVMDVIWTLLGRKDDPPLSRSLVRMIGREFTVNDVAARQELGYIGRISREQGLLGYGQSDSEIGVI